MSNPSIESVNEILNIIVASNKINAHINYDKLLTYDPVLVSAVIQHVFAEKRGENSNESLSSFYNDLYQGIMALNKAHTIFENYAEPAPKETIALVAQQIKVHLKILPANFPRSIAPGEPIYFDPTEKFLAPIQDACRKLQTEVANELQSKFNITVGTSLNKDGCINTTHFILTSMANPNDFNSLVTQYNAANVILNKLTPEGGSTDSPKNKVLFFADITQEKILPHAKNSRPAKNFLESVSRTITDLINYFMGVPKETTTADKLVELKTEITQTLNPTTSKGTWTWLSLGRSQPSSTTTSPNNSRRNSNDSDTTTPSAPPKHSGPAFNDAGGQQTI
jgi:hypothetical protein